MVSKIKIGLVFGGRSTEYEVSCRSADSIDKNLDKNKYEVEKIKIEMDGSFDLEKILRAEVIIPMVHGTYGEDGCLQGMLEMYDKAYVGAGVIGSALGMDKEVQKRLLTQAGIIVAKHVVIKKLSDLRKIRVAKFPVFVKPANLGSSVGVTKVNDEIKLIKAIKEAFKYDTKVIVEEAIEGREIEVSVLNSKASLPGEIIPIGHEFYDYEAKYLDENGAKLMIPAMLEKEQVVEIKKIAIKCFRVLEGEGMARVDMFLKPNGTIVVIEINTIPGFTDISMYPKLWEVSGLAYSKLLDKLINLAILRKRGKDKLRRNYN